MIAPSFFERNQSMIKIYIYMILYLLIFCVKGFSPISFLYCFMSLILLEISVVDFHTYQIPLSFNGLITVLGLMRMILDLENWSDYVIGFFCVSSFLLVLCFFSKGKAFGGGDVKLMATAGLLLGWRAIIVAFMIGCVLCAVIHLIRMKIYGENRILAMGPYLSMGIFIAALFGEEIFRVAFR